MSHYGCFNRAPYPRLIPLPAVYNIEVEGHSVVCDAHQLVANPFTRTCVYTTSELGQQDKKCLGCNWRKEE